MNAFDEEFTGVKLQEKIKEVECLIQMLRQLPETKKIKRQTQRAIEHLVWLKQR